jgi:hypothetical protein
MEAAYSEAERPFQRSSSNPPAILQQSSSAGCQTPRRQPIGRLGMLRSRRDRVRVAGGLGLWSAERGVLVTPTVARRSSIRDSPYEGSVAWRWATFVMRPAQRTKEERP